MAGVVLIMAIKGGWGQAINLGEQYHKFNFIDLGLRPTTYAFSAPFTNHAFSFTLPIDFTKTFTLWAGLLGGCFLTMSTHGTDQYLVQRYLCTDKPRRAAAALLTSGAVVFAQFVGFLFIGVLLFAFYAPHTDPGYVNLANGAATIPLDGVFQSVGGDRVFPDFIEEKDRQELKTTRPVWLKFHREWLEKIPNGRHLITENSSHGVPFEEPELIIGAIHQVVDDARSHRSLPANDRPAKLREIVLHEP